MHKLYVENRSLTGWKLIYEGPADWGAVQAADNKYVAENGGPEAFNGRRFVFAAPLSFVQAEVAARVREAGSR